MKIIRGISVGLARFFLSAVFLASGINHVLHWSDAEKMLANIFCQWQGHLGFSDGLQECFASLTPWTPLMLVIGTLLQIVGGLLLLLGVKEKLGALLLILFLIPATILFHAFWLADEVDTEAQIVMFLKNLAILGGLMCVVLHGVQSKSGSGSDRFHSLKIG